MYRARIEVEAKHPEAVYDALLPESGEGRRFSSRVFLEGERVVVEVDAADATALRAALNSYLRLIVLLSDLEEGL